MIFNNVWGFVGGSLVDFLTRLNMLPVFFTTTTNQKKYERILDGEMERAL